jgi:protein-disulfide isomerase
LERALKHFETEVQLVLYPYVLNPTSEVATQAAWCAGEQGKFWDFHRLLYSRQVEWHRLSNPLNRLLEWAQELRLDTAALKSCVQSGRMKQLIEADKDYGRSLQVHSTPTLFINEQRIVGAQSEADLVRTIRRELARVQRTS